MKKKYTWNAIERYILAVEKDLNEKGLKPTGVYGLPRGGLIYATLLSYRMNIPLLMHAAEGCVIIDDIADSGRTLSHYTENDTQFNKYYITTMFKHPRSIVEPDFYMYEKNDDWIVYPYEEIGEED